MINYFVLGLRLRRSTCRHAPMSRASQGDAYTAAE